MREVRRHGIAHLLSSGPYWSNHLIGLALSRLTGLSWTAQFRDPWTGIPQWKLETAISKRVEAALERMVVARASSVVCVTDLHARLFRQLYPDLPPSKFVTIPNGFDELEWQEAGLGRNNGGCRRSGKFVIRYTGSLYQRRNPRPVFRALQLLIASGEIKPGTVAIDLMGWCDVAEGQPVSQMADECKVADWVTITGPRSRAETLRSMVQADLLLLLAEAQPYQIPGKAYEYLRAGRPVLALTPEGALAQLLRQTGGAWVVDPADEAAIAAAVRDAYRRWSIGLDGPKADWAVVTSFDRRLLAGRIAELFDSACRPPASAEVRR